LSLCIIICTVIGVTAIKIERTVRKSLSLFIYCVCFLSKVKFALLFLKVNMVYALFSSFC
jgi:hypothetical protein